MANLIKTHMISDGGALDPDSFLDAPSDNFVFTPSVASPSEQQFSPNGLPAIVSDGNATPATFASLGSTGSGDASSGTTSSDLVTFSGSGIVFNNTFAASVTQAYKNDILAAEQDIASHWSNSITLNIKFDAQAQGQTGDLASNSFGLVEGISYASLKAALIAHDGSNPDAQAAVNSLPTVDPSGGLGWSLPVAYARMLGLTQSTPATDDTVTLNTSYNWTYGQDVVGTIEHEISEGGMGRIGALGKNTDDQGNALWSTMDLFRYSSAGVRDYTDGQDGKAAFFSVDGSQMLLQFNNQYQGANQINDGDTADFNTLDVFGFGSPGTGLFLSATDLKTMDVLGWTPVGDTTAPSLVADTALVVGTGLTEAIASSMLRFDDNASTHVQETYSVITGPAHGTLLNNGVATSSFTQADIDNGLITYHEIGNFSSDVFTFKVTDASNNATTTQQFNFQIVSPVVIESFGSTSLTEVGNHFYLDDSGGAGPSLKYGGTDTIAGQAGGWVPIGAEITAGGYEVAWKLAGADQYSIWTTDSNGNWTSFVTGAVSGSSSALVAFEASFHQDLNGDGYIGVAAPGYIAHTSASVGNPAPAASVTAPSSSGTITLAHDTGGADVIVGLPDTMSGSAPVGAQIQNPSPILSHDFHLV